jgi:hypothetical protein
LLGVRDLLALRLVSSETKSWLDTVMLGHKSKAFTLSLDDEDWTLDGFMDEQNKIPFKTLNFTKTKASFFYSHALLPSFLQTYGPQIHRIQTPSGFFLHPNADEVPPQKELSFYQGLPHLTHLSLFTSNLGENVPLPTIEEEKLPFLRQLQSFSIRFAGYEVYDSCEVIRNIDFLRHCPNLRKLSIHHDMHLDESVKVLTALGDYFAARNGWKEGIPPTLTIFIKNTTLATIPHQQHQRQPQQIDEGMANKLLEELAASDGGILIENMPITLLNDAVRHFCNQPGTLRRFGKCVRSLIGFSSSLYEVKLPNMRKLRVDGQRRIFLEKEREGDYTKTVSWPKLETIKLDSLVDTDSESDEDAHVPVTVPVPVPMKEGLSYMKKLVFESGLRSTVKRLDYDFHLHFFSLDDEVPHLLHNFPNLTQLTFSSVSISAKDAESFRSFMRRLPTSVPKLQWLDFSTSFPLKDEDFLLGMNGDDDSCCVPPLLQLSGNYYQ